MHDNIRQDHIGIIPNRRRDKTIQNKRDNTIQDKTRKGIIRQYMIRQYKAIQCNLRQD